MADNTNSRYVWANKIHTQDLATQGEKTGYLTITKNSDGNTSTTFTVTQNGGTATDIEDNTITPPKLVYGTTTTDAELTDLTLLEAEGETEFENATNVKAGTQSIRDGAITTAKLNGITEDTTNAGKLVTISETGNSFTLTDAPSASDTFTKYDTYSAILNSEHVNGWWPAELTLTGTTTASSLVSINLTGLTTSKDHLLNNITTLTTVSLPTITTANSVCSGCTSLTAVSLPALTTTEDRLLRRCSSLTTVSLPSLATTGDELLHYATNLTTVSLPSLISAGSNTLANCTQLVNISAPALRTVGNSSLCDCKALVSATFPALENAAQDFMGRDTALTTLNLPALKTFGTSFLTGCTALTDLYLGGPTVAEPTGTDITIMSNVPDACTIHVPATLVDAYKATAIWASRADHIVAI